MTEHTMTTFGVMTARPTNRQVKGWTSFATQSILATLVLAAFLIGAEYVGAAVDPPDVTGSITETAPVSLVAAELDPVFMQKLAQRSRRAYERSHPLTAPAQ